MGRVRPIYDPAVMQNRAAREVIRSKAIETYIPLEAQTFTAGTNMIGQTISFIPENIGLVKGFWIEIQCQATNTGSTALSSFIGPCGLISNFTFIDGKGITRVNVPGYYLHFLNSYKQRFPFAHAAKFAAIDTPVNYGSNCAIGGVVFPFPVSNALWVQTGTPQGSFNQVQILNGAASSIRAMFYLPLAYSDTDYRGAIYAGTLNTQMSLNMTINPNAFLSAAPGDQTNALFLGSPTGAGTITNLAIAVTQVSMDQLPVDPATKQPILPLQDIATVYELQQRSYTGLWVNVDYKVPFPDYRDVLSTLLTWSATSLWIPSQFRYFGLRGANRTFFKKWSGTLAIAEARNVLGTDLPMTHIWFEFRDRPISNNRYGSLSMIVNSSQTVPQTTPLYQGLESFVNVGQLINAN